MYFTQSSREGGVRESGHFFFEPLVSGSHFAGVPASGPGGIWKMSLPFFVIFLFVRHDASECVPLVSAP